MCTHWYIGMGRTGGIAVWTMGQWVTLWNPTCTHWYSGMGRTGGIAIWTMGQWVSLWESQVYQLVQWDGMDRWDSSMDYGTVGQSVGIPCVPIGTVGWDGQVG